MKTIKITRADLDENNNYKLGNIGNKTITCKRLESGKVEYGILKETN